METKEKFVAEDAIKSIYVKFTDLESFAKIMLSSAENENDTPEIKDITKSLYIFCEKFESVKGEFDIYLKELY